MEPQAQFPSDGAAVFVRAALAILATSQGEYIEVGPVTLSFEGS